MGGEISNRQLIAAALITLVLAPITGLMAGLLLGVPVSGYTYQALTDIFTPTKVEWPNRPAGYGQYDRSEAGRQLDRQYDAAEAKYDEFRAEIVRRGWIVFAVIILGYPFIGRAYAGFLGYLCDWIDRALGFEKRWGSWSSNRRLWFAVFWPILALPSLPVTGMAFVYAFLFRSPPASGRRGRSGVDFGGRVATEKSHFPEL